MKNIFQNKIIGLIIALLFFQNHKIFSQQTINYPTGFKSFYTISKLNNWSNNSILLDFYCSKNGKELSEVDSIITYIIDKSTLSNINFKCQNKFSKGILGTNQKYQVYNGKRYLFQAYTNVNMVLHFSVQEVDSELNITKTIISDSVRNRFINEMKIMNNEIFISYSQRIDSLTIGTFDFNGKLIRKKEFNYINAVPNIPVNGNKYFELPHIENGIVMKFKSGPQMYFINQKVLDTIKTFDPDGPNNIDFLNNHDISTLGNDDFFVHNSYFSTSGTAVYIENWQTVGFNNADLQYFYMRQYWDGTYDIRLFGPKNIDNRAYAYNYNATAGIHAIAGSVPFASTPFQSQEQREVLLYVWDDNDVFDSIRLFGDKNHVPLDMIVDDNGDIFIAGIYNEPSPTEEAMVFLTKLPQFAIGLAKEKANFPQIKLYPNPVSKHLNIENSTFSDGATFQIYNGMGQLKKSESLQTNQIDVEGLSNGQYLIQITENNNVYNALFIKH